MENRIYDDGIIRSLIEDFERKSTDRDVPKLIHGDWKRFRVTLDDYKTGLNASKKILPETRLTRFIPIIRFGDIVIGLGRVNNPINHVAPEPAVLPVPKYGQQRDARDTVLCAA
jgi:hypothetical protein